METASASPPPLSVTPPERVAPSYVDQAFASIFPARSNPAQRGERSPTSPGAAVPGGGDVFGVAELHFRSEDDFRERMFDSPGGRKEIFEDIPKFMSLEASTSIFARERIVESEGKE